MLRKVDALRCGGTVCHSLNGILLHQALSDWHFLARQPCRRVHRGRGFAFEELSDKTLHGRYSREKPAVTLVNVIFELLLSDTPNKPANRVTLQSYLLIQMFVYIILWTAVSQPPRQTNRKLRPSLLPPFCLRVPSEPCCLSFCPFSGHFPLLTIFLFLT